MTVFSFRLLQFHQTLVGLEVSFVIREFDCVLYAHPSPFCHSWILGFVFSLIMYRYCILCKICHDSWERCNISETTGWRLLHKARSLHHNNGVFHFFCHYLLGDFANYNLNRIHLNVVSSQEGEYWCSVYITGVFVWIRVKECQMWTAGWWWESFGTRCTSPSLLWWMLTLMVHIICLSANQFYLSHILHIFPHI